MSVIKFTSITQHSLNFLFSANRYAAENRLMPVKVSSIKVASRRCVSRNSTNQNALFDQ